MPLKKTYFSLYMKNPVSNAMLPTGLNSYKPVSSLEELFRIKPLFMKSCKLFNHTGTVSCISNAKPT